MEGLAELTAPRPWKKNSVNSPPKRYPHISHSDNNVTLIDMADRILNVIDPDLRNMPSRT